eukprot:scaffold113629_cov69-Attheya_sp.AAC.2
MMFDGGVVDWMVVGAAEWRMYYHSCCHIMSAYPTPMSQAKSSGTTRAASLSKSVFNHQLYTEDTSGRLAFETIIYYLHVFFISSVLQYWTALGTPM